MNNLARTITLLILIILSASLNSFSQTEEFDYGQVENGIYQNDYFNFSIVLPTDWIVQSKEQMEYLTDAGKKLVAGDDENMKAVITAAEVNIANLLAVFQYELGSAVDYNPGLMIIAENVKNLPGIKDGSDYLFQAKKLLNQAQFKYDYISEEFEFEEIDKTAFYKMDAAITYMGLELKQTYFSTVLNGFSFSVIISYVDDDQKEVLLKAIQSMTFNNS